MENLKKEIHQMIEKMDEYQIRLVLAFLKTIFP